LIAQKYTSSDFLPFVVVKWRFTSRILWHSVQNWWKWHCQQ
jgi:hypothetical protein